MANLLKQLTALNKGEYLAADNLQSSNNFFDWFCSDRALENRGKKLFAQLRRFIIKYPHGLNLNECYVIFKNNCPVNGVLYDDFRICDCKTGNVLFTVTPKSGHKCDNGMADVWGKNDKGEFCQLKKAKNFSELLK